MTITDVRYDPHRAVCDECGVLTDLRNVHVFRDVSTAAQLGFDHRRASGHVVTIEAIDYAPFPVQRQFRQSEPHGHIVERFDGQHHERAAR